MESMKLPVREKWGEKNMNLKLSIHNQIPFGRFLCVNHFKLFCAVYLDRM